MWVIMPPGNRGTRYAMLDADDLCGRRLRLCLHLGQEPLSCLSNVRRGTAVTHATSAFPIARPKARNANANSEGAGSATARNGARLRRTHPRSQAATRPRTLSLQGLCRNEPLGRTWSHRRQRRQHRSRNGKAGHRRARLPRRVLRCQARKSTMAPTSILGREVAVLWRTGDSGSGQYRAKRPAQRDVNGCTRFNWVPFQPRSR
jgi:hypothetical protein